MTSQRLLSRLPKENAFRIGPFIIRPYSGHIHPQCQETITVECAPAKTGVFNEEIIIKITNCDINEYPDGGCKYNLLCEGCLPAFNSDPSVVFEEHRIISDLSQLHFHPEIDYKGIYSILEKVFIFSECTVGVAQQASFRIQNLGKVPCEVYVQLRCKVKGIGLSTKDIDKMLTERIDKAGKEVEKPFDLLSPAKMSVQPQESEFVFVRFTPSALQAYQGLLVMSLEGLPLSLLKEYSPKLIFDLNGEGQMPEIMIKGLYLKNDNSLIFPPADINKYSKVDFLVANTGMIKAKVSIFVKGSDVFTISQPTDKEPLPDPTSQPCDSNCRAMHLHLLKGQETLVTLWFKPIDMECHSGELLIKVEHNPYDSRLIQLTGNGMLNNFVLHVINDWEREDQASWTEYLIDFEGCEIGREYMRTIYISNNSHESYQCEWHCPSLLTIVPSNITIDGKSSRMFMCKLNAKTPIPPGKMSLTCDIFPPGDKSKGCRTTESNVAIGEMSRISSSSRARSRVDMKSSTPQGNQPTIASVNGDHTRMELTAVVSADYSEYQCPNQSIRLKDTLMLQTRCYNFDLTNIGKVPFHFFWSIKDVSSISNRDDHDLLTSIDNIFNIMDEKAPKNDFSLESRKGRLNPGDSCKMSLLFRPLSVKSFDVILHCDISNSKPDSPPLEINVEARSLLPYINFLIPETECTKNKICRERNDLPITNTNIDLRVIEILSIGPREVIKTFQMFNPTSTKFNFKWTRQQFPESTTICCEESTQQGCIGSGCYCPVTFIFKPKEIGTSESRWDFEITDIDVVVQFDIIGSARLPQIYADKCHVLMKPSYIGGVVRDHFTLHNYEHEDFFFKISQCDLKYLKSQYVTVKPKKGLIPQRGNTRMTLEYKPENAGKINVTVACNILDTAHKVNVNVKSECFLPSPDVYLLGDNNDRSLIGPETLLEVETDISTPYKRKFIIVNKDLLPIRYKWYLGNVDCKSSCDLEIDCEQGKISTSESKECTLTLTPLRVGALEEEFTVKLEIIHGCTYVMKLMGKIQPINLKLSFRHHDFGVVFPFREGRPFAKIYLEITNASNKTVALQYSITETKWLTLEGGPSCLFSGKSSKLKVNFIPRDPGNFKQTIFVVMNGLVKFPVILTGKCVPMQIEVYPNKVMDFGALKLGCSVIKTVKIRNVSVIDISVSFKLVEPENNRESNGIKHFRIESGLDKRTLNPHLDAYVSICFEPTCRLIRNYVQLVAVHGSHLIPILQIVGDCLVPNFSLSDDTLVFGNCHIGSSIHRVVNVCNIGDIGARFKWRMSDFAPEFSIIPTEGYLAPGKDIPCSISYHPEEEAKEIAKQNIPCIIENFPSCCISLYASSLPQPLPKDTITFRTNVRRKVEKNITFQNRWSSFISISPVITGMYWSAPSKMIVPARDTAVIKVTFLPLTLTDEEKLTGNLFIPLPEGTSLTYQLHGYVSPPGPVSIIKTNIPSGSLFKQDLPVKNWWNKTMTFEMSIVNDDIPPGTIIKKLDTVEVLPNSTTNYNLEIMAFKEMSSISFHVKFVCLENEEWDYFDINYNVVSRSLPTEIITGNVRHLARHAIQVNNPTSLPVTYTLKTDYPTLVIPSSVDILPGASASIFLEWIPMKEEEIECQLECVSSVLGTVVYNIVLRGSPPLREKPVHFKCWFGSNIVQHITLSGTLKNKQDFTAQVDHGDFHVVKIHHPSPSSQSSQADTSVEIFFEPSSLATSHAVLTISSPTGTQFIFPLIGESLQPKPQGPFLLKPGVAVSIPFKNVTHQSITINCTVNNPVFTIRRVTEVIKAKKETSLSISMDTKAVKGEVRGAVIVGKLVVHAVSITSPQEVLSRWTYYLKGTLD